MTIQPRGQKAFNHTDASSVTAEILKKISSFRLDKLSTTLLRVGCACDTEHMPRHGPTVLHVKHNVVAGNAERARRDASEAHSIDTAAGLCSLPQATAATTTNMICCWDELFSKKKIGSMHRHLTPSVHEIVTEHSY